LGWANQEIGADNIAAVRDSKVGVDRRGNKYGSIYMASGETRMNFAIKGPDAWGAKTMGFIEFEFTGDAVRTGAAGDGGYGSPRLRHAFIKLTWPTAALTVGQQWQGWGLMPSLKQLGNYYGVEVMKGSRDPGIRFDYNFTKSFMGNIGIYSPYKTERVTTANIWTSTNAQMQDFARSEIPFFAGGFDWKSDVCGKIGPFGLWFGIDGYWGREKNVYTTPIGAAATNYGDKEIDSWAAAFKGFIPIIPEKKGNKTNALSLSGVFMRGQNWGGYYGPYIGPAAQPIVQAATASQVWTAPSGNGYWAQLQYYFTDKVSANLIYQGMHNTLSLRWKKANVNNVESSDRWTVNVIYDVNPAFSVGAEYSRLKTAYAWYAAGDFAGTTSSRTGTNDNFRVAAWYFF
jgi:hypothetical protein